MDEGVIIYLVPVSQASDSEKMLICLVRMLGIEQSEAKTAIVTQSLHSKMT